MNIKIVITYFFIVVSGCLLFISCKKSNEQPNINISKKNDSVLKSDVKQILSLNIDSCNLKSDLQYFIDCDIFNDTLFIIGYNNVIIKICFNTGGIYKDSMFVDYKSFKGTELVINKIIVKDGFDYVSTNNKILRFSHEKGIELFAEYPRFISDFYIDDNGVLVVLRYEGLMYKNKDKNITDSLQYPFADSQFIRSDVGVCYAPTPDMATDEFILKKNKIIKRSYFSIADIDEFVNPYIAFSTQNYFVCMSYSDRRFIYFIDKENKKIIRKINLSSYIQQPSLEDIQLEEGIPSFKLLHTREAFFIVSLEDNILKVLSW